MSLEAVTPDSANAVQNPTPPEITQQEEFDNKLAELRAEQVSKIVEGLAVLGEPQLVSLKYAAENNKYGENLPQITNQGAFDVAVDPRALEILFSACEMSAELTQQIQLTFRDAGLSDRDYHGRPIGGLSMGDEVEVYTALPHLANKPTSEAQMRSTTINYLQFKPEQFRETLLHELRHQMQKKLGLFTGSMGSFTSTDHDSESFEQDAIAFSTALLPAFEEFIVLRPHAGTELYTAGQDIPELENIGGMAKYVDTTNVLRTTAEYPAGQRLLDACETFIHTELAAADEDAVNPLLNQIDEALGQRQIGFAEWRFLLRKVIAAAKNVGNFDIVIAVETHAQQYAA